ncbi:MAG TPA: hypothetical protein VLS88_16270 [Polyangiales bacterium]|nr:hypothetical protein [Polyangiales bacterium]
MHDSRIGVIDRTAAAGRRAARGGCGELPACNRPRVRDLGESPSAHRERLLITPATYFGDAIGDEGEEMRFFSITTTESQYAQDLG